MVKKILPIDHPKLREKSKPVQIPDKRLWDLVKDLEQTLNAQDNPPGIGLAAPQIGTNARLFITKLSGKIMVFVNPKIIKFSKKTNDPEKDNKDQEKEYIMEGCLSLPNYYGPVKRSWQIKIQYSEIKNGKLIQRSRTFKGFIAQVIQHETDHLNGILFIDRLFAQKRQLFEQRGKDWHEVQLLS